MCLGGGNGSQGRRGRACSSNSVESGVGLAVGTDMPVAEEDEDEVRCVAGSQDGSFVAVGKSEGSVAMRTVLPRAVDGSHVWKSTKFGAFWIGFSEDGKLIASIGRYGQIRLWSVAASDSQRVLTKVLLVVPRRRRHHGE